MVTTRPPKTIVKPTALGPVANTDTKLLIYGLFQKGRVLAQDGVSAGRCMMSPWFQTLGSGLIIFGGSTFERSRVFAQGHLRRRLRRLTALRKKRKKRMRRTSRTYQGEKSGLSPERHE